MDWSYRAPASGVVREALLEESLQLAAKLLIHGDLSVDDAVRFEWLLCVLEVETLREGDVAQ